MKYRFRLVFAAYVCPTLAGSVGLPQPSTPLVRRPVPLPPRVSGLLLPMRCVHPWQGDTKQVGRLAGAPPRGARRPRAPAAAGPRRPPRRRPPAWRPVSEWCGRPCHLWPHEASHQVRGQTYLDVLRDGPHAPTSNRACLTPLLTKKDVLTDASSSRCKPRNAPLTPETV